MKISRREFIKSLSILAVAPSVVSFSSAESTMKTFPVLRAKGSYGSLGYEHGKQFAPQIKKNLDFYKMWIPSPFTDKNTELTKAAESFIPLLKEHFPHQIEEMEGIAKGAELTLADIMIINARTDLKFLFTQINPLKENPGCTAMAVHSSYGGKPSLALGQNWDWNSPFIDTSVILRLEPDNSNPLVTFTEAGMLGKIGFNSRKLGVCLNFLQHESTVQADPVGIPVHCLLRTVMECSSLSDAYQKVALSKRCASANFLMAQDVNNHPQVMNLELTPDSVSVLEDSNGFFIHTNHFVSPSLEKGCMVKGIFSSENRYRTGYDELSHMNLSNMSPVNAMKHVLKLRKGAPFSISRSPAQGSQSTTIASIIMDLTHNTFYLAAGSPHENPWIEYSGI